MSDGDDGVASDNRTEQSRVSPGFFVDEAMWQELLTALALLLVIEGILPFANPRGFRDMLRMVGEMDEKALRNGGLFSMIAGLLLLYLVR